MKPHVPGRLHAQGLDAPRFSEAAEVVGHLGCVQSQLPDMAMWGLARRTEGLTYDDVALAFERGEILRTHVLRPTWHFVLPGDVHELLALTGPRVERLMASSSTGIDVDTVRLDRTAHAIVDALAEHGALTRAEIAAELDAVGLGLRGQALAHAVMHAEVRALIINGPMRGRHHTYVLLDAVAPRPGPVDRDELLSQVARRYGTGHGPFRDVDLSWWTSLTLTECRRAVELGGLRPFAVEGQTYWTVDEPVRSDPPPAMLLPNFDEYVSYRRDTLDLHLLEGSDADLMRGSGLLVLDGLVAGAWTRTVRTAAVDIEVRTAQTLTPAHRDAIDAEAHAFGRFLGREAVVRTA